MRVQYTHSTPASQFEQVEQDRSRAANNHPYWKHRQLHRHLTHSRIHIDQGQRQKAGKQPRCREREGKGECAIDDDNVDSRESIGTGAEQKRRGWVQEQARENSVYLQLQLAIVDDPAMPLLRLLL